MPRTVTTPAAKPVPCKGRLWNVRPVGTPSGTYSADPDLARLFVPQTSGQK